MQQRYLFLSIVISLFVMPSLEAQPDIQWQKSLGGSEEDIAYAITQTPDGGFVVAGQSRSSDGDITMSFAWKDFWVVKLDAVGEIVWQNKFGGSNHDIARDIKVTADGGYIVAGNTSSEDGQLGELQGFSDTWVVKLSENGELEWEKTYGGSSSEYAYAIEQTPDGDYFVGGSSQSTNGDVTGNHGNIDYWVMRLDSIGDIIWENSYGGSKNDFVFGLDLSNDGGCVVAGRTRSSDGDVMGFHTGGNFLHDNWVVKLSADGDIEWQNALGGSDNDEGRAIRQTTDGGYIVAGTTGSEDGDVSDNHGSWDAWVVKLDSVGNITWENTYGGFSGESADAIDQTSDGGYIVSGCQGPAGDKRYWTFKLTADGELDWQLPLGGTEDDRSFAVKQTSDDEYIIAGRTFSDNGDVSDNHGDYDFWVVKLGACGVNTEVEILDDGLQSLESALTSTYQWMDCSTETLIEGEEEAIFIPSVGGEYAVIVTNGSCIDTSSCIVFCPLGEDLLVIGDSTLVIEENTPNLSIQWMDCSTGMLIENATDPTYSPTTNGSFAAVINDDDCSTTTECVTVCPEPIEVEIMFAMDTLFAVTETNATSYNWYNCSTGSFLGGGPDPYFVPSQSGEYGVYVYQGICRSSMVCTTYCSINSNTTLIGNTIHASADPVISFFQWINCADGSVISGETNASFTPGVTGDYAVIITQETCADTSSCVNFCAINEELLVQGNTIISQADTLNAEFQWFDCSNDALIQNANNYFLTPEEDGEYGVIITEGACLVSTECVNITIVATHEPHGLAIDVYPNPVSELLYITPTSRGQLYDFVILNQQGVKLLSGKIQYSGTAVDVSQLPAGVYYFSIKNIDGTVQKRFVKL